MPLKKIPLPPGFDKNDTASQAEGRWIDGDNVRFQYGSPEKIGGWRQITTSILVGAGRDKDYSHDGISHWAEDDELVLKSLPNIKIYKPKDDNELKQIFSEFLYSDKPCYLNLRR